jgi:hypothetical protein
MRQLRLTLLGLALAAAVFAAGRLTGRTAGTPAAPPPGADHDGQDVHLARSAEVAARVPRLAQAVPSTDLQAAVRAELERLEAEKLATKPREPTPPAETPELATGISLVDGAIQLHTWTDDHRSKLRALLPTLDRAQRRVVLAKLTLAINAGQIEVASEDGGPL